MRTRTATHAAPRQVRGSLRNGSVWLAAVLMSAFLAACHFRPAPPSRSDALRGEELGRVVDSIVVPPFEREPTVQINAADLMVFRDQFEQQLVSRPGLKAYAKPPTTLANTVTLSGTLVAYEVHEQTSEGMFLRTIDMLLDVAVRIGGDKTDALKLSRAYSYQKLYRTPQGAATVEFDLHNAAKEATGTIVAILAPGKREAPNLQSAIDSTSGENYSHLLLTRGNREAGFDRYDSAIYAWSLLLYNPEQPYEDARYRLSSRALARLAADGATPQEVDALKPLTRRSGEDLEDLRERVVKAIGPNSPLEPKILQLSDEASDRMQLNLARAHYNLASVYLRSHQYDVASYHLTRAYAYDPMKIYLDTWLLMQGQRDLLPKDLTSDNPDAVNWIRLYQRVPAPFTATVSGGSYDRNVMPPLAFQSAGAPARPMPAPLSSAQMPVEMPTPVMSPAQSGRPGTQGTPGQGSRVYGQPAPSRPVSRPAQRLGY